MKRIWHWLERRLWPGMGVDTSRQPDESVGDWLDRICPNPGP